MCCALSGLFDSLSSAGRVCWAKPNHGFFRCQHFQAIIFASAAGRLRRRIGSRGHCNRAIAHARLRRVQSVLRQSAFLKRFFFTHRCKRSCATPGVQPTHDGWRGRDGPGLASKIISPGGSDFRVAQTDLRGFAQAIGTAADAVAHLAAQSRAMKNPRCRHRGSGRTTPCRWLRQRFGERARERIQVFGALGLRGADQQRVVEAGEVLVQ